MPLTRQPIANIHFALISRAAWNSIDDAWHVLFYARAENRVLNEQPAIADFCAGGRNHTSNFILRASLTESGKKASQRGYAECNKVAGETDDGAEKVARTNSSTRNNNDDDDPDKR